MAVRGRRALQQALLLAVVTPSAGLSLDTVREFLTREEDTIVFSLIERARYPLNRPAYDPIHLGDGDGPGRRLNASFAELFIRESEAVQSKVQYNRNSIMFLFQLGNIIQLFLCLTMTMKKKNSVRELVSFSC